MATYLIAFRIGANSTYSDRWDSVVKAIRSEALDGTTWEEMTSFIILKSGRTADDLARSIYINSGFDVFTDKLLVVNSSNNTHATRGRIDYPATLSSYFVDGTSSVSNALLTALMG
ncbi:hypothetical protein BMI86_11900 [Thioclava sp. DLFJ5-1]|uniref:hypothetical protein n=1 Tax=Thioclava sp. DLFJ5-1 TaxID=1915314 RepID=UPI000998D3C3|nr:hypothetical protein [Thioclava sp. DLFJ5-1]OOY20151.1 hypothetical protein BMI86_11900 [Thioclava sp. DLFJ5-1]